MISQQNSFLAPSDFDLFCLRQPLLLWSPDDLCLVRSYEREFGKWSGVEKIQRCLSLGRYVLDRVRTRQTQDGNQRGVPMGMAFLWKLETKEVVRVTMRVLRKEGFLVQTVEPQRKITCGQYVVSDRFNDSEMMESLLSDRLTKRLLALDLEYRKAGRTNVMAFHSPWIAWLQELKIDMDCVQNLLHRIPREKQALSDELIKCKHIQRGSYRFTVDKQGRVHTNLTNLSKVMRSALRARGEPLYYVDIVSSQPTLLGLLMSSEACESELNGLNDYLGQIGKGTLYELLCDLTGFRRDYVKVCVLRDVIVRKYCYESPMVKVFRERFPGPHEFITRYCRERRGDYAALVRKLQRMESDIVVRRALEYLPPKGGPFFTLHDGIFCRRRGLEAAGYAIRRAFGDCGGSDLVRLSYGFCGGEPPSKQAPEKNDWTSAPALDELDYAGKTLKKTA